MDFKRHPISSPSHPHMHLILTAAQIITLQQFKCVSPTVALSYVQIVTLYRYFTVAHRNRMQNNEYLAVTTSHKCTKIVFFNALFILFFVIVVFAPLDRLLIVLYLSFYSLLFFTGFIMRGERRRQRGWRFNEEVTTRVVDGMLELALQIYDSLLFSDLLYLSAL